jgi:AcrR family transcriptional regulator
MSTPPAAPSRALRSDAQRNRQRLLAVAHAAFEEHGVDASLDDIARRAGVGIGTLYRHFPNRDALVESLVSADIERLVALADQFVADDVADGLERWLDAMARHGITYRGLAESLVVASGPGSMLGGLCDRLHTAGAAVVRQAQHRGAVRTDIDPADAVDVAAAIAWITERDPDDSRLRRLVQIAVDGLRTVGGNAPARSRAERVRDDDHG